MNNEKDFSEIGKKTPYRVPENFFAENQKKIFSKVGPKTKSRGSLRLIYSGMAMAAMIAVIMVLSFFRTDSVVLNDPILFASSSLQSEMLVTATDDYPEMDNFIHELSDEELEYLVAQANTDLFLY